MASFVLFWVAWITMFVAALALVIASPGCPKLVRPHWWQAMISYQVRYDRYLDVIVFGRWNL